MTRNAVLAGMATSGHPFAGGVGGGQPCPVGGAGGVDGDPRFGAGLVAGHVLDRGPAAGQSLAQHARRGRTRRGVPPVEDYATGGGAGSVGHAKISCSSRWELVWLAGPGDGSPPGPALLWSGGSGDLPPEGERPVLERLGPDQRP